jgi:hypothetical protein
MLLSPFAGNFVISLCWKHLIVPSRNSVIGWKHDPLCWKLGFLLEAQLPAGNTVPYWKPRPWFKTHFFAGNKLLMEAQLFAWNTVLSVELSPQLELKGLCQNIYDYLCRMRSPVLGTQSHLVNPDLCWNTQSSARNTGHD